MYEDLKGEYPAGVPHGDYEKDERLERKYCYERAKQKADSFLQNIDPLLTVKVSERVLYLENAKGPFVDWTLEFQHAENPSIHWTMSIDLEENYLEERFEAAVRRSYDGRSETLQNEQDFEDVDFGNQKFEELEGKERQKTDNEILLIGQVNYITDLVRREFGLPGIEVPQEVIHVIKRDKWSFAGSALYNETLKAIAIKETEKDIIFKKKLVHEMIHLKQTNCLPRLLNEAFTELLTKRLMTQFLDDPITHNEIEDSKRIINEFPEERDREGGQLFSEDTLVAYFGRDGYIRSENYTDKKGRETFKVLISKIYSRNGNKFKTEAEVFDVFARANVTGQTEFLGIIDDCFGEGTLKQLYEFEWDMVKLSEFIDSL